MSTRTTNVSRRSFLRRSGVVAGGAAIAAVPGAASATDALTAPAGSANPSDEPLRLARVWFDASGPGRFDTTHRTFADGSTEIVLWPGDAARLDQLGLRYELDATDLVSRDRAAATSAAGRTSGLASQPGETSSGEYRTLEEHELDLRELAERFPTTAKLIELPHQTFEERRVLALEISRNVHGPQDGRPTLHVDGLHHAREWPAGEMAIMFAFDLLESDGTDPRVTNLLDRVRVMIVPVVNPDGFHHSRSSALEDGGTAAPLALGGRGAYWRKNRRSFSDYFAGDGLLLDSGHSRYPEPVQGSDAYGVDPNRNYACTWGRPGSSANDVHSQSHRGDVPFSEPETRNIAWLMTTRHVTGALSHHTFAGEIIWPWADEMGEAPDAALYRTLGDEAGAINGYRARKYTTSEGTTPDHFYGSVASLCFLFEHGTEGFHPDYATTIPQMYADNRGAFLLLAERLGAETTHHGIIRGRVVDASGSGVQATLTSRKRYLSPLWLFGDGSTPGGRTSHEEIFEATIRTAADGSFEWHVNPSTRPHVRLEQRTESYEIAASDGVGGIVRHVTIGRGETVDLGDLRIG